tara:strand:+ start:177 stop:1016 length:840 start_codon:yes stop_codon:yes gene_type:complete
MTTTTPGKEEEEKHHVPEEEQREKVAPKTTTTPGEHITSEEKEHDNENTNLANQTTTTTTLMSAGPQNDDDGEKKSDLEDASVRQKTNVSSLFGETYAKPTTTAETTTTTATTNTKTDQKAGENAKTDLPPSCTPEDILGHEGISETDLYRFLEDLDDMAPTIPDQYTNSVLKTVGVNTPDVRVTRLISLAAQKFMQQIADDCFKVQANKLAALPKDEKLRKINQRVVLTTETLGEVLSEYGVSVKKPSLFVGSGEDEEMEAEEVEVQEGDGGGKDGNE